MEHTTDDSITIGPRLRVELWHEISAIENRIDKTHDIHTKRRLARERDALLELFLFGGSPWK
jgi:hypothetical protein